MTGTASNAPCASEHHRLRRRVVGAVATVLLLAVAPPAYAYWTAASTGSYGRAQASTLPSPSVTANAITARSVGLSWTRPFTPTAYALSQAPGPLAGCSAAPAASSTGCTPSGLTPNTSYTWTLSASLHSWVRPATVTATTSRQATTTTLSSTTPTYGLVGDTFSATATVSGNSGYGTPAGSIAFSLYTSPTCSGTASHTSTQPLSGGTASAGLQPAAVGTYYWRASYTPTDSYNVASTSSCSAAVTVTAPAAGAPIVVNGNSNNVPIPYPAGTAAGDLLLLVIVNHTSSRELSTIGSSGWEFIAAPDFSGLGMRLVAWWHTAGTEGSVTLDSLRTDGTGATARVLNYKSLPNPARAGVSSGIATLTASITPSNLTTTAANTRVISLAATNTPRALSLEVARNFTWRASLQTGTVTGRTLAVADRFVTAAGTVPSPTWTNDALVSLSQWAYITVAFTSQPP